MAEEARSEGKWLVLRFAELEKDVGELRKELRS
jgi:hypothetical protein